MQFGALLANQVFTRQRDSLFVDTVAPMVLHLVDTFDKGRHADLLLTLFADNMRLNLRRIKFEKLHYAADHLKVKLVISAMDALNRSIFDDHCQDI